MLPILKVSLAEILSDQSPWAVKSFLLEDAPGYSGFLIRQNSLKDASLVRPLEIIFSFLDSDFSPRPINIDLREYPDVMQEAQKQKEETSCWVM